MSNLERLEWAHAREVPRSETTDGEWKRRTLQIAVVDEPEEANAATYHNLIVLPPAATSRPLNVDVIQLHAHTSL